MFNLKQITPTVDLLEESRKINQPVDYIACQSNFAGARFLRECCVKLNASILTMATAATYYHKFYSSVKDVDYDPYLMACTCIYLSSKVKNDDIKIRDIINIGYHSLHRKAAPLSLDPYFELRDSLVEAELLLMRMLKFDLHVDLPHSHLLFYLNALKDWLGEQTFEDFPIITTSWTILLDSYHVPIALHFSPPVIAAAALYLTLQIYGITVPGLNEIQSDKLWFTVLHPDCKIKDVWDLSLAFINMYSMENQLKFL